jgi:hypothetical protein
MPVDIAVNPAVMRAAAKRTPTVPAKLGQPAPRMKDNTRIMTD